MYKSLEKQYNTRYDCKYKNNDEINNYKKIIPCGILDKGVSRIYDFKKVSKKRIIDKLKTKLIRNLKY